MTLDEDFVSETQSGERVKLKSSDECEKKVYNHIVKETNTHRKETSDGNT